MVLIYKSASLCANKALLALIFCLCLPFLVHGQIAGEARKFSMGLKAGGSVNWASFGDKDQKDTFSISPSAGFMAGALIIFPLKNRYGVVIEGSYSRKSRTLKDRVLTNTQIFHFVDATLLLRKSYPFKLRPNTPADWFLEIGPEISYWLNGKGNLAAEGPGYPYIIEFNDPPDGRGGYLYYNSANRWLFGLVLGAGIKAPLKGNQSIAAELRFVSGHTFLGKKPYEYPVYLWHNVLNYQDTLQMNLKLVSLSVAYTFDFDMIESRKGRSTIEKKVKRNR